AQHPYKTQILDFHSCKTQWATRSLYFEGQKRNQFCILHYRLNLELLFFCNKTTQKKDHRYA
ncbi:MAG: hypothetical protein O9332_15490, partial [Microcystis sp. LE19-10.1B]|uniref:hypothetical protein n=1 Tax=Microcystis sp. LE19-10.1B TaxID=3016428 RepID=UPI0022BC0213